MDSAQISSIISSTINEMFYKIFSSIDNSIYAVLDDFTFIDSDILNDEYFIDIFGLSSRKGILVIPILLFLLTLCGCGNVFKHQLHAPVPDAV